MNPTRLTEAFSTDEVLKRVLNSVSDYAIFTLDPNGIVTTWNDGAQRIKEYRAEEIIGQHYRLLYLPEDREGGHPEHNLRKAVEDGEYREEWPRMKKDGSQFEADVNISPIYDDAKQLSGFIKVVHDISDRKRLERELKAGREELEMRVLQRTAQLNHANQDLEAFCYSIAHDLRIPIRGIIAKCRIADEDYGDLLPPAEREHLESLVATAKRLSELVDDLLEFARLGQKEVVRTSVDLTALARRLAGEIGPKCHSGAAKITVEEGITVDGDAGLLEIVLHNLIENACKYSSRDVNVTVGRLAIGGEEAFYVKDDGMGFDMQYAHKLFQPFERLHGDNGIEGTGIGLANVKRIVVRHGGRIWAEGSPGVGATFFFTLSGNVPRTTRLEEPYEPFPRPLLQCEANGYTA